MSLSLRARLQNRLRLWLLKLTGLDVILKAEHQRLEALMHVVQKNAELLGTIAQHLNSHAELLNAWKEYPILGKIAAELRARKAKQAKAVLTNGETHATLIDQHGAALVLPPKPDQPEAN